MDPSIPNSNTSKNRDADGNSLYPSVYEFKKILMINKAGREEDIRPLVTSLVIAEEIYSPVLTGKLRIRDNVNFFENFGLNGQEIVKVEIEYLKSVDEEEEFETLKYQFVVKDYPLFEKTKESINVQEYDINLISSFAYLSRLQQISRGIVGNPVNAIEEIFEKYLAYTKFNYKGEKYPCLTDNLKAVITQRTPLQAVEYLKSLCYDEKSSPFFVYTTLKGDEIVARSWVDIIDESTNPVYEPTSDQDSYVLKPFYSEETIGTTENLKELRPKILSLSSNIKLDKLSQAVAGGIGSVTEVIDLEARSYDEVRVVPKTESLEATGDTESEFDFSYLENLADDETRRSILNNIIDDPRTSQSVSYLPIKPYSDSFISPARIKHDVLPYVKKYKANMEASVHEIAVYGDPNLSAATKIRIKIPKAVDTNEKEPGIDESLSGVYVVGVNIHTFENGVYTNRLRIIKDRNVIDLPLLKDDVVFDAINTLTLNFPGQIQE